MRDTLWCPVNGWDCPHYKEGKCTLEHPSKECDDYYNVIGDKE